MRLVIQRVKKAQVTVDGKICGRIERGLFVLFGVKKDDQLKQATWLANKLVSLRCFSDSQDKMNLSMQQVDGKVLVVSQFTLYADCQRGNRPDFMQAAIPLFAQKCYEHFLNELRQRLGSVETGKFGAKMEVSLVNTGPVTFVIEK